MATTPKIPGKKIRCPEGYWAFLPAPLPPKLDWSPNLIRALSDADRLVGQLAGEGGGLPNPHLLIRPFIRREAVLSSRIEGTQTTLGELLAAEAGASVKQSPPDLKEVTNYVIAMEYGLKRLKKLPLSLRLIKEIHEKLMKGVRGHISTPGEFRRSQNWIGSPGCTLANASYVPPPPTELMNCLGALEKFLHDTSLPPLVQIALAHYQFEAIHPFLDGNGRVGRLLITLFLIERNILPSPLLYLSAFFEMTRDDYYNRLKGVSNKGDWLSWLEYFLNGVARQSEDALHRAQKINKKIDLWRKKVSSLAGKNPVLLVESLAANPFITINGITKSLDISFNTASRLIQKFEQFKIIKQISKGKRDRTFCAQGILDILEGPTKLI